jgi:hypothetical protein
MTEQMRSGINTAASYFRDRLRLNGRSVTVSPSSALKALTTGPSKTVCGLAQSHQAS